MMRSRTKLIDMSRALLQQSKTAAASADSTAVVPLPVSEMPLILTLDEVNPFPDNPRTSRNPKYDDIKASVRVRGLDTVPKVTSDPERPELGFFFSDGGNTRYAILRELWQETGDERFYRLPCLYKPWPGLLACVIGHLAENEVRGDLSFIEKALGIHRARSIYEGKMGKTVSLRELSALLASEGYPVHFSAISRMEDTVKYLYSGMPALLESGLGAPQIRQLLALRSAAEKTWLAYQTNAHATQPFDAVFGAVCRHFDAPETYSLDMFRDELIGALLNALSHPSLNYDRWLLELDPQEPNRRKYLGEPVSLSVTATEADTDLVTACLDRELLQPSPPLPKNNDVSPVIRQRVLPSSVPGVARSSDEQVTGDVEGAVYAGHAEIHTGLYETSTERVRNTARQLAGQHGHPLHAPGETLQLTVEHDDVSFAGAGLEPVATIWRIPALQDDIEHLQGMAFRLAFDLAEAMGCEAEVKEDKSVLHAAGYTLAGGRPSCYTMLLLSLAGVSPAENGRDALNEVVVGSTNPVDEPLFNDIQAVKLLRLIRVMRRLRELQRNLLAKEETPDA